MEGYRAVFEHLPQPAFLIDAGFNVLEANNLAEELFPVASGSRCLSRGQLMFWLADDIEEFFDSGNPNQMIEKSLGSSACGLRYFRIRLSRFRLYGKTVATVLLTDITERRNALHEVERLAAIVESCDDAIFSFSPQNTIRTLNKGAENIYGYARQNLIGRPVTLLVPEALHPEHASIVRRVLEGQSIHRHETLRRHSSGQLFPVSVTYSPIITESEISGISAISRDITLRKDTEHALKESFLRLNELLDETVRALSLTLEFRDMYTAGHQNNVARLASLIARQMGMEPERIKGLRIAAMLHDIGKICIPMAILAKPTRLSPAEMDIIRAHPSSGREILQHIPFPWPVGEIIHQHHERLDGSGYPRGYSGKDILDESRILAVADVVDAMASHRPYRPALGLGSAIEEMAGHMGTLYDADIVECLEGLIANGRIVHQRNGGGLQCR